MASVLRIRVAGDIFRRRLPRFCAAQRRAMCVQIGDSYSTSRSYSEADVSAFATLTHDDNPMHCDAEFAASGRFGATVVHGMLYASMFSAIVGQRFPGAVYVSQSLEFKKPVFLHDSVTATVTVQSVAAAGTVLDFSTSCANQHGDAVLTGEARVLLPRRKRGQHGRAS